MSLRIEGLTGRRMRLLALVSLTAVFCLSCVPAPAKKPRPAETAAVRADIRNSELRRDASGDAIDAHDGCLQFFHGRYYLYGTAYGRSSGFSINNRFRAYSSPDLMQWTFEGELLKEPPDGVYYRPYVVFNPNTHQYVLFYNWYPKLWDGQLGVAISDTPAGPFAIVNPDVQVSQAKSQPGDGSPFVDNDGTAYFIYTVIGQDHAIRVERLTPDYLGSTGQASDVLARGCEAPVLFNRAGIYYALFDACCCFCPAGSGARVFTSTSPLGPFTEQSNINRHEGNGAPIIAAQQTWVAQLPTPNGRAYIWMGDRWGSRPDGVKGHDFQFWSEPLRFEDSGAIQPMANVAAWTAEVTKGQARSHALVRYSWLKKKDPNPLKTDPCTNQPLDPNQFDGL